MDIVDKLIDCGAIKFGEFILKSGRKSKYYVDIKIAETNWQILDEICNMIVPLLKGDKLAGMELGAVPIVVGTALKSKKNYIIIRKMKKEYGTERRYEGIIEKGDRFTIIEDVTTTGSSVLEVIKVIEDENGVVERVIAVVDREEGGKENITSHGYDFISLIRASEILKRYNISSE